VTQHVFGLLEETCGLVRLAVPLDAQGHEPAIPIFHSPDFASADKLLVVVCATWSMLMCA
jgi:hypothetical protein